MAGGAIVRPSVGKGEQLGNKISNIQVGLKLKSKASLIHGDTKLTTAVFTLEEAIKDINRTLLKTGSSADNDIFNDWLINGTVDMATNNMISVWIDQLNSLDDIVDNEKQAQDTAIEKEQDKKDTAKAEADKKAKAGPIGAVPPSPGATAGSPPGATAGSPPGATAGSPPGATAGSPPGATAGSPPGATAGATAGSSGTGPPPVVASGLTPGATAGSTIGLSGTGPPPPGATITPPPGATITPPPGATITSPVIGGSNNPKTKTKRKINIRLV
jgi:hypothetical protein